MPHSQPRRPLTSIPLVGHLAADRFGLPLTRWVERPLHSHTDAGAVQPVTSRDNLILNSMMIVGCAGKAERRDDIKDSQIDGQH